MPDHDQLLAPMIKLSEAFAGQSLPDDARAAIWEAALTDDVVWEAPFTDNHVYIRGRRAVGLFFDWLIENVPNFNTVTENVFFVDDGQSFVVQVSGGGPVKGGGRYEQKYFSLIRIRDGKIAHFIEHFIPGQTYKAFGQQRFETAIADIQARADAGG